MKSEIFLVRSEKDRRLPREILVPEGRANHRPVERFRLRLRTRQDVEKARKAGVPVYLWESWVSMALGYGREFKPRLLIARDLLPILESPFKTIPFVDREAARHPKLEDVVVAMLRVDKLGARRLARAQRRRLDPARLLKRVFQEDLEGLAYRVRLDEFAPGLPPTGQPLSREELAEEDSVVPFRELDL